jgi:adenylate cyclase
MRYLNLAFPGHAFGDDFAELIHSRTEGSPLFMADLLRYLRERGFLAEIHGTWSVARELPDLSRELPESVRGMIQRKLDRLDASDRQLLAAASVQGCEFDSQIVADALRRDSADVEERLSELARVHGLLRTVRASELPDQSLSMRCSFVHILYQQALYQDLLPTRRAALSLSLSRALVRRYGESDSTIAAELAYLYEEGRDFLQSARQFWLASQNAARVFAHGEAITLARRGLKLLQPLPATPRRAELERQLYTTLGLQLQVTEGFGSSAAQKAYERARHICLQSPEGPSLFPVLWGLWLYYKVHSELTTAQHFAADLSRLARKLNDPDLALQAHQALAMTAFCRGQLDASQQHVEQAVALYDRRRHAKHAFEFGQDPAVICKAFGAVVLWLLGYPDAAAKQSEDAIRMSESLSPSSQAVAWYFASMVYQMRREPQKTRSCAERCLAISSEHGYSFWQTAGGILHGWAAAAGGGMDEGIAAMREGIRDWQNMGSETYRTYFLGILAETLCHNGAPGESLELLETALKLAVRTGEGFFSAELHRLKGEALLAAVAQDRSPSPSDARDQLQQALFIARTQNARSLELRSAMSMAGHCPLFDNAAEAREQLAHAYNRFTDGFQTADLKKAVDLLASPLWRAG